MKQCKYLPKSRMRASCLPCAVEYSCDLTAGDGGDARPLPTGETFLSARYPGSCCLLWLQGLTVACPLVYS